METGAVVIGVDYGTDSVRTVIVDAGSGKEIASAVFRYPRWERGQYCDPGTNRFRQHPLDYLEGLQHTVRAALAAAPPGTAQRVRGISVDTTGSTPVPVDKKGTPLALTPGFEEDPDAMFVLWKDHTAVREAAEINTLARSWGGIDYTQYEGGIYSSEWFWAKLLHVIRANPSVRAAAFSWVEHCDWIPAVLTGNTDPLTMKRSRCAAGHKAMWHASYDGLPAEEFLVQLDPLLAGLRARLYKDTYTNEVAAGTLSAEWASILGLPTTVTVGVGAFDAHMGAVGGEIRPFVLTKIMGTSTCDMLVAPADGLGKAPVRGICGQVDGSILPGMVGLEAGQSAFGDVYAWYIDVLLWPVREVIGKSALIDETMRSRLLQEAEDKTIRALSEAAAALPLEVTGVLALDWMNGRRTPDANQMLKGAITGLNLGSDAPHIFRALVEATAFGARSIADRFRDEGVKIEGVIALGGVAKKSPFIMQTVADVMDMPIAVPRSEQTCALGAAMCAAAAAGVHPTLDAAKKAMGSGVECEYRPDPARSAIYSKIYERYCRLGSFIEAETMKDAPTV